MTTIFRKILTLLLAIVLLTACGKDTPGGVGEATSVDLTLHRAALLHRQPDAAAPVVRELTAGDVLMDLGEVSAFTTPLARQGRQWDEPWLHVQTADSLTGWIYAEPPVFFADAGNPATAAWQRRLYLRAVWGREHYPRYESYITACKNVPATPGDWTALLRQARELRTTLEQRLRTFPDLAGLSRRLTATQPDWLPGFQNDGEQWWIDWRQWHAWAGRTPGDLDDRLARLELQACGGDSIEYIYPAWRFAVGPAQTHSLFGRQLHLRLLRQADTLYRTDSLPHPELRRLAAALVQDMTYPENTYWESRTNILSELDSILASRWALLTEAEQLALRVRRRELAEADSLRLPVDYRSGRFD